MRPLRDPRNRWPIIGVVTLGILFGAANYLLVVYLFDLRSSGSPNRLTKILGIVVAFGFCHMPWICNQIIGWPKKANDLGVLLINAAYYPCLFLLIRRIAWRWRHKPIDDAPRCTNCEYNLTGNESGLCPECGEPVPESKSLSGPSLGTQSNL